MFNDIPAWPPKGCQESRLAFWGGPLFGKSLIWMLPPMIYRVLNPELDGLADEGAYLLMCKEVLPVACWALC